MKGVLLIRDYKLLEYIGKVFGKEWLVLSSPDIRSEIEFYPVPEIGYTIADK
jgi:hypothetical protein